jgi:hypothetical protein
MPKLNELDHYNKFVNDQMTPGKFASAEFMALAMGPPMLTDLTKAGRPGEVVMPIGGIQNYNISQNMAVARVFEIGSKRSYMFPGKTVGAVTFGKPYYHGPSLLRMVMGYYASTGINEFEAVFPTSPADTNVLHKIRIPAGYENLFINLASDLFTQPHGELVVMKDTDNEIIGSFYLEQSYVPSYSLAVDAQGLIWQEAVQIQFERLMPVKISTALPLDMPEWDNAVTTQKLLSDLSNNVGNSINSTI